jgi:NTE family protein
MTVLVLSGSGAMYAAHFGAAQRLYEDGLRPSKLVGTSGGSLVCAFLSTGAQPKDGLELCKNVLPLSVISPNWFPWTKRKWGFANLKKLEKMAAKYVPARFCETKIPLHVVATDVVKQEAFVFGPDTSPLASVPKAICASSSMPDIFSVVETDQGIMTDGGVANNFAIDYLKEKCVGIRLMSTGEDKLKEPTDWASFNAAIISCFMREIERKHIEDASLFAKTITVRVPWSGVDFVRVDGAIIDKLYATGYEAVSKRIESGWTWKTEQVLS